MEIQTSLIPQETIQLIIETARIEEVVGEFVSLKRRGVNLLGNCPFHNEKTPSFTVSPAKGIYKCFGCGAAGNSVKFLMEHEQYNYPEALRYLAKKYQIEVDEEEQTPEQQKATTERESLYHVSEFAKDYFATTLWEDPKGKAIGLSYLRERGLSDQLIKKFELGYSPNEWTAFSDYAQTNSYPLSSLEKTGLTILKENNKVFDRFKGRVMFPIHNLSGRVIGFGGRILSNEKNAAKYLNSPESEIYNKSKVLYGIYFARQAILKLDNCLLVEGYTDVISLHQSGIENVVASSGTSLTTDQIKLIKRFTSNITILYDGDPAGIKASFRGIDMILEQGMNVKIVLFPEGEDPDSFSRKHSAGEVSTFIEKEADDFIRFKTKLLQEEAANDPVKRGELIKEIVQSVSIIPDEIMRSVYVKECSLLMDIPEQALINDLNKRLKKNDKDFRSIPSPIAPSATKEQTQVDQIKQQIRKTPLDFQEENLIRMLLTFGTKSFEYRFRENESEDESVIDVNVAQFIVEQLEDDSLGFLNPIYQKIYNAYKDGVQTEKLPTHLTFIHHSDDAIVQVAVDLLSSPYSLSENWLNKERIHVITEEELLLQAANNSVLSFKQRKLEQEIHELQLNLKDAPEDESEKIILLILKKQNIQKLISERLGRIVLK
ncbi:MAG: DNA primase [Bacteroidales bacterium]|nr:DNA primase [Bacteroidales bacterium]